MKIAYEPYKAKQNHHHHPLNGWRLRLKQQQTRTLHTENTNMHPWKLHNKQLWMHINFDKIDIRSVEWMSMGHILYPTDHYYYLQWINIPFKNGSTLEPHSICNMCVSPTLIVCPIKSCTMMLLFLERQRVPGLGTTFQYRCKRKSNPHTICNVQLVVCNSHESIAFTFNTSMIYW